MDGELDIIEEVRRIWERQFPRLCFKTFCVKKTEAMEKRAVISYGKNY